MSEDMVPNSGPQTQAASSLPPEAIVELARREVLFDLTKKYQVKVGKLKQDGRVNVTIPLPALVDGEWHRVEQCWTCTPAELRALADTLPSSLYDTAVSWQYAQAANQVRPMPSYRSVLKRMITRDAKLAYHCIKHVLALPEDMRPAMFQRLVTRVQQALSSTAPDALVLTAWLIEELYQMSWEWPRFTQRGPHEWKEATKKGTLKRPTQDKEDNNYTSFARGYLYSQLYRGMPLPETLMQCIRELEYFLKKVPDL